VSAARTTAAGLGLTLLALGGPPAPPALAASDLETLSGDLRAELQDGLPAGPTRRALAASVTVYDPDRSVLAYSLERSVEVLRTEERAGATTSVTVNSDVLFAFGSDALDERARATVAGVAADLPSGAAVQVVGLTDGVGDGPANQALSERRARAVAAVLGQGRPDLVLTATGRGETEPLEREGGPDDATARAANRRVVVTYPG